MYKNHFAQWGLRKNITARDLPELVHQVRIGATKDSTALAVRGRRIPLPKAGRYLKRHGAVHHISQNITPPPQTGKTPGPDPVPTPRLLNLPTDLRFPDEISHLLFQFVAGSCEGGKWCPDSATTSVFFASGKTSAWVCETVSGSALIQEGHYKRAFKILDDSFDQLKALLREPDPALFIYLYFATLQLPENISQRMRAYAAEMSAITLPANHPMNLVWSRLSRMGNRQMQNHAWNILQPYFQVLVDRFRYCEYGILMFSSTFTSMMAQLSFLDAEATKSKLSRIAHGLELLGGYEDDVLFTKLSIVDTLVRVKEYEDAVTVLREAAHQIYQGGSSSTIRHYLRYYFEIHKALGATNDAVDAGRSYMRYSINEFGPEDDGTLNAIRSVQSYFVEIGRADEANILQRISG
jgi:hypothetical protein